MARIQRNKDGKLDAYAWPGGYQIIYITDDGGVLCPACANGENGSEASETADSGSGWKLEGYDIFFEGPSVFCDHCNDEIESAYGDPEEEEA